MKGFAYEMVRVLTSRSLLVITAIIIIISFAVALSSAVSPPGPSPAQSYSAHAYAYGANGSYSIVTHIGNGYGYPVEDVAVNISLPNSIYYTGSTDKAGYTNFTGLDINLSEVAPVSGTGNAEFKYMGPSGSWQSGGGLTVLENVTGYGAKAISFRVQSANGTVTNYLNNISRYSLSQVAVQNQPARAALNMFYLGESGSAAPPVDLYYMPDNTTLTPTSSFPPNYSYLSERNMTEYSSYQGGYSYNVNPSNLSSSETNTYIFALFTSNGSFIQAMSVKVYQPYTNSQVDQVFYGQEMELLDLFVPLMAMVTAYISFGREKASGVLDSVIARPVSRRSLIVSRYLANVSAVFTASVAAFAVSTLIYFDYLGTFIPSGAFLLGLWSMLAVTCSMVGLMYLVTNFIKSENAILGAGIAFFFVLDLLWTFQSFPVIPAIVTTFIIHPAFYSIANARTYILLDYISPTGMIPLTALHVVGNLGFVVDVRAYSQRSVWLTLADLFAGGIAWIAVSFGLAVLFFTRRG